MENFFEKLNNSLGKLNAVLERIVRKRISNERAAVEVIKSIKFLSVFLIVFLLLQAIIYFVPMQVIEKPIAEGVLFYLQAKGYEGQVLLGEPVLIELANGVEIQISYLCTGLLEMIVLVSAVIASLGISWRKRVAGILAGVVLTQVFNFLRIFITVDFILSSNAVETIEFIHNILFRLALLAIIVGIYAVWFYSACRTNKTV